MADISSAFPVPLERIKGYITHHLVGDKKGGMGKEGVEAVGEPVPSGSLPKGIPFIGP